MKKSIVSLVVASAVSLTGTLCAEEGDAAKKKGVEKKRPDLSKAFAKLDKDSDKKLTLEEFSATKRWKKAGEEKAKKAFARIDGNNDKSVTLEEMKASREKAAKRAKARAKGKGEGKKARGKKKEKTS